MRVGCVCVCVCARARLTGTAGNVALVFWCWLAIGKNPCHSLTPGFAKLNSTNQSHFAYSPQGAIALVHLYVLCGCRRLQPIVQDRARRVSHRHAQLPPRKSFKNLRLLCLVKNVVTVLPIGTCPILPTVSTLEKPTKWVFYTTVDDLCGYALKK
jgi:hypothetical protein